MKEFVKKLWFLPKENTDWIFYKSYSTFDSYTVEVDFKKEQINYWDKIRSDSKTTQNFSQEENRVVLECVNRLLEKWYHPTDIILEKTFPSWHGTSWRLDILVQKNWKSFLMIECKTWGKEFEKEFKKMQKDGGQLFTYFQQDRDTDYLMLYTSNSNLEYKNEIVKIEESYKETSNVVDLYTRWNKFTKQNGIFEDWIQPYDFESKALTYNQLEDIKESDASFIFNRFLEILRHNTVSDKPNAFNKMFTLFLCKIYDELDKKDTNQELDFQWKEWVDDNIIFQKRLTDLYRKWMIEFLSKQVSDFSDKEFNDEFWYLSEGDRAKILEKLTKIRLKKNNEFAIKEVFDDQSFDENAIVLKEVVELLQNYKFRYTKKQPFLWDFFELLLTTGLKQEAGQFFTPVPITRFICRSIPIENMIDQNLSKWTSDIFPKVIDYAAGSGHFLIEAMEEIQKIINKKDVSQNWFKIKELFKKYTDFPYTWAGEYIYWIEKDYRLVRTSKVGCYLNGDGIATVIHGDGLDSFKYSQVYKWDLTHSEDDDQYNGRFDLVLSNPPYSVSAFKGNLKPEHASNNFTLFDSLTDASSEIEALFIERTAQLLKEWGIAGIILPSSILSNTGIYTKAREIILKNFDIVAITELGSNTFMATGTNTVVLFLRKRNKFFARNLQALTDNFFIILQDVTLNWVEKAVSKYINKVWSWISFEDYLSLIKKAPNEAIENHEIFKEYRNKIKLIKKTEEEREKEFFDKLIALEKEKLFYFVVTYPQQLVLVKSGEKNVEKEFLGYEFSNRKGNEWIHPIQRWKLIDECTKLFDPDIFNNPNRASTYIYDAFQHQFDREISEELKDHVFRGSLLDLLMFDRADFEKTLSLNNKKKVIIESKRDVVKLGDILSTLEAGNRPQWWISSYKEWIPSLWWEHIWLNWKVNLHKENIKFVPVDFFENTDRWKIKDNDILICKDWALTWKIALFDASKFEFPNFMINEHVFLLRMKWENLQRYLFHYLLWIQWQNLLKASITGQAQWWLNRTNLLNIKIPLPPKDIQQKIVDEIWKLEMIEEKNLQKIWALKNNIEKIIDVLKGENVKIKDIAVLNPSKSELLDIDNKSLVSFVEMASVSDKWFIEKKEDKILKDLRKGSYTYFKEWDILIAKITPCMENWKCAIAKNLTNWIWMWSSEFHVIRVNEEVDRKLLFTFLNRRVIRENAEWSMTWASWHRRVPISFYENLEIPLPPLEIQKQIVAQIEKIEQEIEKLQSELREIPNKKQEILKKYL